MSLPSISIIVTTYNWPKALNRALAGLAAQKCTVPFEVIVADDGSTDDTRALIQAWQPRVWFTLKHCWHPDEGFKAAQIRNKAVAMARNDYCVFIDGDCIPRANFVQKHAELAESGWFVAGNRLLLSKKLTVKALTQSLPLHKYSLLQWLLKRFTGGCNRWVSLLSLPLGVLRKGICHRWQGVKTCNLGVWSDDFIRVNGFDEQYTGWGLEDSDLVIRLLRDGILRKQGKFATSVLHLWHPEQDRSQISSNQALFEQTRLGDRIQAQRGVGQYLQDSHDIQWTIS